MLAGNATESAGRSGPIRSGDPLGIILSLGLIAAIGLFIYYLALRGDKPDEKK